MPIIDLADELSEIEQRYPEWWRSGAAQWELQALWGKCCNPHGVMAEDEIVRFEAENGQWNAHVRISQSDKDWFSYGLDWSWPLGGGGYAPSVWHTIAYTARQEAFEAATRELIRRFENIRTNDSSGVGSHAKGAQRMIEILQKAITRSPQMELRF